MKNTVLFAACFILASMGLRAQNLTNVSFETWASRTSYLNLSLAGVNVIDTAVASEAVGWTSTNMITAGNIFQKTLVTQSSTAYTGSSSIQLTTDSVRGTVGPLGVNIVAPGFAISGQFPIDLQSFALAAASGSFNPLTIAGAGVPVSGRKAKIGGYVKFNPQGGDTAYVVALLRAGQTVVAQAVYKHATTDAAFVHFEAPFVYQSCLQPDTLVYVVSSGDPYTYNRLVSSQPTGLHYGSTLLADSVYVSDTLTTGFALPPTVVNDTATTLKNTAVTVPVVANDISCYTGGLFGVAVASQPAHGTAAVSASGDSIIYTPATGYTGVDSFLYTATIGGSAPSSPGVARMKVQAPTGVLDVTEGITRVYPNPASSKLHITTTNNAISTIAIYDMLGGLVRTEPMSGTANLDVTSLNDGIYLIRFSGAEGKVLSSSRFSVVK